MYPDFEYIFYIIIKDIEKELERKKLNKKNND